MELTLTSGSRSEAHIVEDGIPQGSWSGRDGVSHASAQHNCWSDAVWFFPAFSALAHGADRNYVFSYAGEAQSHGSTADHIRVWQVRHLRGKDPLNLPLLSAMDFYLDSSSHLPLAVAFKVHPDNNMLADIPAEVRFSDYRSVSGVQAPFRVERFLNGSLLLDLTIDEVAINSGIPDPQL
jgi:hypothetical protein